MILRYGYLFLISFSKDSHLHSTRLQS